MSIQEVVVNTTNNPPKGFQMHKEAKIVINFRILNFGSLMLRLAITVGYMLTTLLILHISLLASETYSATASLCVASHHNTI